MTIKKYPAIKPEFSKDKKSVYLDVDAYESIFEEIQDLQKQIKELKKSEKQSHKKVK